MKDMRTSLAKIRGLGVAGEGSHHFLLSRVTAIANIPLTLFSLGFFLFLDTASYQQAYSFFGNLFVSGILFLTIFSTLFHMHLGMQMVISDYVHGCKLKLVLLMANTFFVFLTGVFCSLALLRILLGG